jgi:16S rRNA (guanine527-N7)-methyltransferase
MTAAARLAELVDAYDLPDGAAAQLARLTELLADDPSAPTAIRDPRRVLDDHVADSLVAVSLGSVRGAQSIADLGSGAGVPGLVLAAALPETRMVLVESVARKCAFLEAAAAACALPNVRVVCARAEEVSERDFDVVTARALASLPVVAEYAAPLLLLGGMLVAWRGQRDPEVELEAEEAAAELGLEVGEIIHVHPYRRAENRYLHLMSKVRETPSRFPRRAGMASKRPLGRQDGPDRPRSDRPRR